MTGGRDKVVNALSGTRLFVPVPLFVQRSVDTFLCPVIPRLYDVVTRVLFALLLHQITLFEDPVTLFEEV